MTEQVQPLTLQKTTNLEEHQQFFSKINEIIDNLAPTVEEAEAATATANQAIADANTAIDDANTAISTANTAVSTANAASSQAQAAATTVAGYNARLTAVEDTAVRNYSAAVQVIDSDLQVVNGHDLAVAGDVNIASQVIAEGAEIANMAIEKSGVKTVLSNEDGITVTGTVAVSVEDTATGVRSAAAVNGKRLQNDLDAYTPMVRDTGNKTIAGTKTFTSTITRRNAIPATVEAYIQSKTVSVLNADGNEMGYFAVGKTATSELTEFGQKSTTNPTHYAKLLIRMTNDARVDLILESSTSKGYEQHVIYTFGAD